MSLTLTADITATARTLTVTGTVPASVEPGYRFRLDDELLEFTTFVLHDVAFPSWTEQHQNPQAWKVLRGRGGTVAAPHTAGVTVEAVLGGLVAAADDDPLPDPFASGGGGSLPTGWTQDPETGAVDTGGQNLDLGGSGALEAGYVTVVGVLYVGGASTAIRAGAGDPSAGGGLDATVGSLYLRTNGQTWQKDGAGATDWTQLGGSGGGGLSSLDVHFTEETTAGTYTATVTLPAGATVLDLLGLGIAAWAADTVSLDIGDDSGPTKLANALDVGYYVGGPYDRATHVGFMSLAFANGWDSYSGYVPTETSLFAGPVWYPDEQTITFALTTTIGSPPVVATGDLLLKLVYLPAPVAVEAAFA